MMYRIPKWRELFGMDRRSLALFRIGVALVAFVDVISRFADIRAHYTGMYCNIYWAISLSSLLCCYVHPLMLLINFLYTPAITHLNLFTFTSLYYLSIIDYKVITAAYIISPHFMWYLLLTAHSSLTLYRTLITHSVTNYIIPHFNNTLCLAHTAISTLYIELFFVTPPSTPYSNIFLISHTTPTPTPTFAHS